jgi:hypothetical protein
MFTAAGVVWPLPEIIEAWMRRGAGQAGEVLADFCAQPPISIVPSDPAAVEVRLLEFVQYDPLTASSKPAMAPCWSLGTMACHSSATTSPTRAARSHMRRCSRSAPTTALIPWPIYQTPRVTLLPLGDPQYFPRGVKHRYTRKSAEH